MTESIDNIELDNKNKEILSNLKRFCSAGGVPDFFEEFREILKSFVKI